MKFEYRISLLYVLIGVVWILLSDRVVLDQYVSPESLSFFQSLKGIFYVLATGFLLFLLVRGDRKRQDQIRRELKAARNKAQESDRLKSAFLANLSHEIRTPMNGIMGFSELLNDPEIRSDEIARYAELIHFNTHQLLGIINNVIDISKLETGQHKVHLDAHNLAMLAEKFFAEFTGIVSPSSSVVMRFDPDPEMNPDSVILTDAEKLKTILINFVSNSVKFTREGSISFGYRIRPGETVRFFVSDTGIGIHPDHLQVIFDRFRQINSQSQTTKSGSGLGLAIARGFAGLLSADIQVESTEGKGTTMYAILPASQINQPDQE